jgi:hypothetical protein
MDIHRRKNAGDSVCRVYALIALICGLLGLALLSGCEGYRTDQLIRDLEAKEADVRMSAAIDLGKMKDPRVVPPLIAALRDKDRYVPARAEDSLVALGPLAVEPLIAALRNKDEPNRPVVARILGKIRDVRSIDPLEQVLKDPKPALAKEARDALLKVLSTALQDSRLDVRGSTRSGRGRAADRCAPRQGRQYSSTRRDRARKHRTTGGQISHRIA